jgi:hypothetical protein
VWFFINLANFIVSGVYSSKKIRFRKDLFSLAARAELPVVRQFEFFYREFMENLEI